MYNCKYEKFVTDVTESCFIASNRCTPAPYGKVTEISDPDICKRETVPFLAIIFPCTIISLRESNQR